MGWRLHSPCFAPAAVPFTSLWRSSTAAKGAAGEEEPPGKTTGEVRSNFSSSEATTAAKGGAGGAGVYEFIELVGWERTRDVAAASMWAVVLGNSKGGREWCGGFLAACGGGRQADGVALAVGRLRGSDGWSSTPARL
nr:hypothetical protein Iba_chr01aCG8630 [Ipomoea batatas]